MFTPTVQTIDWFCTQGEIDHSIIIIPIFLFFISIVGPRPLTLLKAPTRFTLKLESTPAHSHSATISIWHFNVVKYLKKKNNSSTTFEYSTMHSQWGTCVSEANGGTVGSPSSAVVWSEMVSDLRCICLITLDHVNRKEMSTSVVSSDLVRTTRTIQHVPKVLCYPQCFYTHNCTGIINPL